MKYIIIPGTNKRLAEGSIVTIPRISGKTWIVKNGWYNFEDQRLNGWYFSSMPESDTFPINDEDLRNLVIVSSPCPSPSSPSPCSCPPPHLPCPPPHPPISDIVKSVERYFSGKYYFSDQLLYIEEGTLYQTTKKFRSSWEFDSVTANFENDIHQGNLIPVIEEIQEAQIRKYFLNFVSVFGTDTPSKSDADTFLSALDPPVIPGINISFTNSDEESETYGHIFTYYPDPEDLNNLIFRDDTISGGGSGISKIQKYTINAEEYYDKTSEPIIDYSGRAVGEGLFDITFAVSVKLVDDALDNPAPVFANQPITYEGDMWSPFVYADLKEIMLYFEFEEENEDTGEMELIEFWFNASIFVRAVDDYLNPSIKFEINGPLSATISARYEGIDNDTALEIREIVEDHNKVLKAATLYYVPYEKGDETIAEVSI